MSFKVETSSQQQRLNNLTFIWSGAQPQDIRTGDLLSRGVCYAEVGYTRGPTVYIFLFHI